MGIKRLSLELTKEVIKTTTLKVTKATVATYLVMAVLISLPIISMIGVVLPTLDFNPPPPDPNRTTGRTGSSTR